MRGKHTISEVDESIDLTPMLDVVFILLIFFIVTASFVKESGIEVDRPTAASGETKDRANIIVGVNAHGDVWIQKRQVDIRAVRANIERMIAENPQGSVVVQADSSAQTGVLVKVLDQVKQAGVPVAIATRPD